MAVMLFLHPITASKRRKIMLKIYFNEKSDAENKIKITVKELCVIAEVTGINPAAYGKDVIETLRPYSSYILVDSPGKVKNYRKMNRSDFKFLDMNRLGVAVKMDFARLLQLYASKDILQLDTGIIGGEERDIIIRVFEGRPEDTEIEADEKYEVLSFNSDDLVVGDHPRQHLWDSYAVEVNGKLLMANKKGIPVSGDFMQPVTVPEDKDYLDFHIVKYKGDFEGEKLTRDIDDEDVLVESTCGVVNNRRVALENGEGAFRLYPLGHNGPFKLKLGRKWYEVWNEYNLVLEGDK
uniref:Uncharacterized protein n=1 Tax=Siphoviridae sp. ctr0c13 TaxID=2825683 RepID=A0A8S5TV02_9CAUD|nr:MAG TPA: hypothetical protein [Siphoviridae sp. ctr0c13]